MKPRLSGVAINTDTSETSHSTIRLTVQLSAMIDNPMADVSQTNMPRTSLSYDIMVTIKIVMVMIYLNA